MKTITIKAKKHTTLRNEKRCPAYWSISNEKISCTWFNSELSKQIKSILETAKENKNFEKEDSFIIETTQTNFKNKSKILPDILDHKLITKIQKK